MRKLTTTSIMNDDELAIVARGIRQLVGENVTLAVEAYGLDLEAILRFMPVAEKCRIARARKDLSLKDAARALRVPQYRLKDIEENRVRAVEQVVLIRYIEFLDLKQWFSRWKASTSYELSSVSRF
jgi:hypothetical protein